MALTKRSENNTVYLEVKHFCLWRQIKQKVAGCDEVEVTNPKNKEVSTKYGYRYADVSGRITKIEKYDTDKKYSTRYFGFKAHIIDGSDSYVLDMPYRSQFLRRFLHVLPNIKWTEPLSITIFKGKKQGSGTDELAVWFKQGGETVRNFYTKDNPNGMPAAVQDRNTKEWDFREQHSWLVDRLKEQIPAIEAMSKKIAPPIDPADDGNEEPTRDNGDIPPHGEISDDDVPF